MRSELDLERALAAAGLRAPVRWEEVTGSTNATAYALAMDGAPEWTLVAAGHQTAGRGRLGRSWEDVAGRALLCSIVLRPSVPPEDAGLLTLLAGAAWVETAREVAGVDATAKWPNDLLVGDAKAGGVLAESRVVEGRLDVVILGSGINLEPPQLDGPAAGLGADADPADLLAGFLVRFRAGYEVEPAPPVGRGAGALAGGRRHARPRRGGGEDRRGPDPRARRGHRRPRRPRARHA